MTESEPPQPESDNIQTGDIKGGKGIAIGRYAQAVVIEGDLAIYVMDKQVAVIPPLALIAIGVITAGVVFLVVTQVANLWAAFVPAKMTGDFNVAVAQFQVVGQGEGLDDAEDLAQSIANAIDREMQGLASEMEQTIEVRPPRETGAIKGGTEEERAEAADALAEQINADVVVYGVVEVNGIAATVKPEFYVRSDDFAAAAEVTGQYRMGSPTSVDKVDNMARKREIGDILAERSRALTFIIYGMADFVIGQYEAAEANFEQALRVKAWDNPDVVHVLLGNAALKQRNWTKAEAYYWQALEVNPNYARAYAGLGGVFYHQAAGDVQSNTYDTVDTELLDQAIEKYQQATDPGLDHSPLADTPAKADFGLGRAYLLKALVHAEREDNRVSEHNFALAIQAFEDVIQAYGEGDNPRIQELTAHAHAHLGLVFRLTNQLEQAIPEYEKALELMPALERTEEERAPYEAALGDINVRLGQLSQAVEWYERAVEHAPAGSDEQRKYQERLDELR
jgi:tetratricopeptide (TPR) repeat protein